MGWHSSAGQAGPWAGEGASWALWVPRWVFLLPAEPPGPGSAWEAQSPIWRVLLGTDARMWSSGQPAGSVWEGEGLRGSDCCSVGSRTHLQPPRSLRQEEIGVQEGTGWRRTSLPPVRVEKERWICGIKLYRSHSPAKTEKAVPWITIACHFSLSETFDFSAE